MISGEKTQIQAQKQYVLFPADVFIVARMKLSLTGMVILLLEWTKR